ncbi:MAG: CHAT domain-containing protein [Cyanobacteria bacterium J06632_22]
MISLRRVSVGLSAALLCWAGLGAASSVRANEAPADLVLAQAASTAGQGQLLLDRGREQLTAGNVTVALASFTTALQIAIETGDNDLGMAVVDQLYPLYLQTDLAKAAEVLEQGAAFARANQDLANEVGYLGYLRDAYFDTNNYEPLLRVAERFGEIAEQFNRDELTLLSKLIYASAYAVGGDFEAVYAAEAEVMALSAQLFTNEPSRQLEVLDVLVFLYDKLPDYERGIGHLENAIAIAQAIDDRRRLVVYQAFLGKYHEAINQFDAAAEASEAALSLARALNVPEIEALALSTLADIYDQQGDYGRAIATAEETLALAQQLENATLEALATATLASAHSSLGNYDQAIGYGERSIQLAQSEGNINILLGVLGNLYGSYLDLGDFERAEQLADEMLAQINQSNPHSDNVVRVVETFAGLFATVSAFVAGDYAETVTASETALVGLEELRLADDLRDLFAGLLYLFAGVGYSGLEEHDIAIAQVSTGLDLMRSTEFSSTDETALFFTGNVYYRAGDLETALDYYNEALALEPSFYARAAVARLYRDQGLPNVAVSYYKQAINQIEQVRGNVRNLSSGLEESFFQAFVSIDGLRIVDIYRELADVLLSQGRIGEAQQVLELLKLEELREFQGAERSGNNSDIALNPAERQIVQEYGSLIAFGQEVLACQQSRCDRLSNLLDQRDILTTEFNRTLRTFESEIQERLSVDRAALDTQDFRRAAADIVEAQPHSLLIYPLVLEDKIWILWAAEGGVLKSVEVTDVGQRELSETIVEFRQLIETPRSNINDVQAVGKQLYDWLIGPIESEIEANNIENLVFALDRTTRYLPMGALYDGRQYVVENYTTSTILSAGETDMEERLAPGTDQNSVLALGVSDSVDGYSALPNVPAELDSIVVERGNTEDTTGVYQGDLFLNQAFDRRTLRDNLAYHTIAHIATHAEFVPGSHENSYLLLGNGNPLKISDIQALQDLSNIHLVVLSACETALSGPDQDGIEISGVAHQFLSGGAKSVIASLWKVNDASTSLQMQLFYQQLADSTAENPITKAEALRQAQLTLLSDDEEIQLALATLTRSGERFGSFDPTLTARRPEGYTHPYYWAPFVLIGNNL